MVRSHFYRPPRLSVISGLLVCISLSACNLPLRVDGLPFSGATATVEENCFYSWASEPRPELAAELQDALEAAGLENVEARAKAMGETSCGEFGWAYTSYEARLWVDSLEDRETLGNLFKRTLIVMNTFATNESDTISVIFNSGEENISGGEDIIIRLATGDLVEARQQAEAKSGEALFDAIMWINSRRLGASRISRAVLCTPNNSLMLTRLPGENASVTCQQSCPRMKEASLSRRAA